ncbi:Peptidase family M23 [Thermoactinomyces sp. DSM 45892]|nr:Peptidase family M23 [Thermoactinomyces sp. DSM 45892]
MPMLPTNLNNRKDRDSLMALFIGMGTLPSILILLLITFTIFMVIPFLNKPEALPEDGTTTTMSIFRDYYEEAAAKYNMPWEILAAIHAKSPPYSSHASKVSGAVPDVKYKEYIESALHRWNKDRKYQVTPALVAAVMEQESNFNPNVVSSAGAVGLMQLMPSNCEARQWSIQDCKIPVNNIDRGVQLLVNHLNHYNGNIKYTLAAYNAGAGNVKRYGGVPPFQETQNYVKKVPERMGKFAGEANLAPVKDYIFDLAQTLKEEADTQKGICKKDATHQLGEQTVNTYGDNVICGIYKLDSKFAGDGGWDYVNEVASQANVFTGRVTIDGNVKYTGGTLVWPVANCPITGRWNERRPGHFHRGLDLACAENTLVRAAGDGVIYIDKDNPGGFGHYLGIKHTNGLISWYGHTIPYGNIHVGTKVTKGQYIAQIKQIGRSTGPHLHFEVHVGSNPSSDARDPLLFLQKK